MKAEEVSNELKNYTKYRNGKVLQDDGNIQIRYGGGKSRYSEAIIDYMIGRIGVIEFYAEVTPIEQSESLTFTMLRTAIIEQALENNISKDRLRFWFDDIEEAKEYYEEEGGI